MNEYPTFEDCQAERDSIAQKIDEEKHNLKCLEIAILHLEEALSCQVTKTQKWHMLLDFAIRDMIDEMLVSESEISRLQKYLGDSLNY